MTEPSRDPAAIAAKSVYDLLLRQLRDDQGVHAETAICAAGAITGDAIAVYANAGRRPDDRAVERVVAYVRERCSFLAVALPGTDEPAAADQVGSTRDALSLARELRPGVAEIVEKLHVAPGEVPLIVARCIPALLSNTSAVLDSRLGYAIALHALHATAAAAGSEPALLS